MIGDLLIARPFLIAATAVGAVAFVVSLPFTAASGSVGKAARRWWSIRARKPSSVAWAAPPAAITTTKAEFPTE